MKKIYVHAGRRIYGLRMDKGYTREQLAEKVGVSDHFLYEIEYGRKGFSAENLLKISQALGVPCDYVIGGDNPAEYCKEPEDE